MVDERTLQQYKWFGQQMKRMSTGSLKSISILQEVLVKHRMVPTYSLVHTAGSDHDRSFTFKAAISEELFALGQDGTKQGAKHRAATNLMQYFIDLSEGGNNIKVEPASPVSGNSPKESYSSASRSSSALPQSPIPPANFYVEAVEAQTDDDVVPFANSIGMVQEWCQQRQLPLPVYVDEKQTGKSHIPTFTTSCTVQFEANPDSLYKTIASAGNKKAAKKIAAHKMWLLLLPPTKSKTPPRNANLNICTERARVMSLQGNGITEPSLPRELEPSTSTVTKSSSLPNNNTTLLEKVGSREIGTVEVLRALKSANFPQENVPTSFIDLPDIPASPKAFLKTPSPPPEPQEVLLEMQQALESSDGAELLRLKVGAKNRSENHIQTLWNLCEEQGVEVDFMRVSDFTDDGQMQCMVQLTFGAHRTFVVCFGVGDDARDARDTAARNALQYLRMMATGSEISKEE